jgi:hypothetical protein
MTDSVLAQKGIQVFHGKPLEEVVFELFPAHGSLSCSVHMFRNSHQVSVYAEDRAEIVE